MSPATQPLVPNPVDISITVSPQLPATPTFNEGLIVGTSAVIPSVTGTGQRLRLYQSNWATAMIADGFETSSPEYIAAGIYFSQPGNNFLWVGRQDLTALQTIIPHAGNAGTGYVVGDIVTVVQSGASLGQAKVTTIGGSGAVTGLAVVQGSQGTGYSVATGLATTGGTGTALEVDITVIGETCLQAITACRLASVAWCTAVCLAAVDADNLAIAAWAEGQQPIVIYFFTTADAAIINNTANNVGAQLQTLEYSKTIWIYSTTQSGLFPNNIYAAVAAMGVGMGLNTGLAGSYFDLMFKQLIGIATEPLSSTQIATIKTLSGNLYLSFANSYEWIQYGVMCDGSHFDQQLNRAMLVSNITFNVVDVLISRPAVLQTDGGEAELLQAVNDAGATAASIGYISPGVWDGITIPVSPGSNTNLISDGDSLPLGYKAVAQSFVNQTPSNRAARQGMPIYFCIIESGSIESIAIGVNIQQ